MRAFFCLIVAVNRGRRKGPQGKCTRGEGSPHMMPVHAGVGSGEPGRQDGAVDRYAGKKTAEKDRPWGLNGTGKRRRACAEVRPGAPQGNRAKEGGSSGENGQSGLRPVLPMRYRASLFRYRCSPPEPGTSLRCPVSVTFALPPSKGWPPADSGVPGTTGMEKPPLRVAFGSGSGQGLSPLSYLNRIRQTISMSPGPSLWTACHSPSGQTAVSPAWSMTSVPLSS